MSSSISNVRPAPDQLLADLADYALGAKITSDEAYDACADDGYVKFVFHIY